MQVHEVGTALYIYPDSVWEPTLTGWVSRPLTEQDKKRRQAVAEELNAAGEVLRERILQQG